MNLVSIPASNPVNQQSCRDCGFVASRCDITLRDGYCWVCYGERHPSFDPGEGAYATLRSPSHSRRRLSSADLREAVLETYEGISVRLARHAALCSACEQCLRFDRSAARLRALITGVPVTEDWRAQR